ncbi:nuclear transport factor 2 family protein [Biformimicrobium ophioploci]|uniref:SnoaL-like domain-containing protein n=1 Tax=Biformimicrobium ophioploci TaxID=3036711 RepID=A0ABQ6M1Z6_9GAMM|nr:nuclear transport factor 2 family protein [Microbulbifer sp. NKW57]GMG88376.1 hypothetical protein MNKW57_26970 [Microbulbifer sp. NKW57]
MSKMDFLQLESDFRASYNAYAEGLDSKDWAKVRTCFADDVYLDYGPIIDPTGSPDRPRSADEWVKQLHLNIGGFDLTRHTITNHRVSVEGDSFSCKAYLIADHIMFKDPAMPITGPDDVATVIGEYTNHYRQVSGEWKIFRSRLDIHWSTGNIDLFAEALKRVTKLEEPVI